MRDHQVKKEDGEEGDEDEDEAEIDDDGDEYEDDDYLQVNMVSGLSLQQPPAVWDLGCVVGQCER